MTTDLSPAPRGEIILLAAIALVVVGQTYVVIPLFAPIAATWGGSTIAAGLTTSAFALPYAGAGLIAGTVTDLCGARPVIRTALVATACLTVAAALAPTFAALLLLRGAQGAAAGFVATPLYAYVMRDMAQKQQGFTAAAIASAAMSSAVVGQLFGQVFAPIIGWRGVFAAAAPLMFCFAWWSKTRLCPPARATAGPNAAAMTNRRPAEIPRLRPWRRPQLLALYGAAFTMMAGFVALWTGIALYGPAHLRGNPQALFALRAVALPVMITVPLVLRRLPACALGHQAVIGFGLSACSMVVMAGAPHSLVTLALGICGATGGILIAAPALVQGVARTAPDSAGAALSLYTFAVFLGVSAAAQTAAAAMPWGLRGLLAGLAMLGLTGGGLAYSGLTARPGPPPPPHISNTGL